jgi:prepilin signal peptidase PulO-like enzyme (type II secretory pathway)
MLISRFVTLYLAPFGVLANYYELLPVSPLESLFAAIFAASSLITINYIFKKIKGYDGLGQGDIDLIFCIAAWLGVIGVWFTILIGSTIGVISSLLYMLLNKKRISLIPFGPFLALGSLVFMTFSKEIINFFMY